MQHENILGRENTSKISVFFVFLSYVIILVWWLNFLFNQQVERSRELTGKFEAGDGNAVCFLYRTIETQRNMRDEPFKVTRNLTHCGAYAKADTLPLHG